MTKLSTDEFDSFGLSENALFRAGANTEMNACVGDNGGPYDLMDYGRGFFQAGQELVNSARSMNAPIDILVYPIAFSFRHGIELYLKATLAEARVYNGSENANKGGHKLDVLWRQLDAELGSIRSARLDGEDIDIIGNIIGNFVQIDPTGQVFRYPADIKGNPHLKNHKLINVEVLSEGMATVEGLIASWYYWLEDENRERASYVSRGE